MNDFAAFITDIFFPNRCPICREFIKWNELICSDCNDLLDAFPKEICSRCGKRECICGKISYDAAFICFYYENTAKKGIFSLKDGHKGFGIYLGRLLGEKIYQSNLTADGVVPIPMSGKSYRKRRYNQAEIIAKEVSRINNIPLYKNLIFKSDSDAQHNLNKTDRMKNVSAFYKSGVKLDKMSFILCDDVITTGSTLNRCAALLKEMGADCVYAAAGTTTNIKKE